MISELFDSPKGEIVYGKRTICEVNRALYDLCVLHLNDKPEAMRKMIKLLEEAYMMGIKMNAKLIEHKDGNDEWSEENKNKEEIEIIRKERIRLVKMMEEQKIKIKEDEKEKKSKIPTDRNPIFVLGTGRCGTSTLQRIFASIENVVSLHEGDFVVDSGRKKKFKTLTDVDNVKVQKGDIELALKQIQPRVDYIKECQSKNIVYVESNPFIWPYIPALRQHFPQLRIIHLIRNPFTCVRSLYGWPSLYNKDWDDHYSRARVSFPDEWSRLRKICEFWKHINVNIRKMYPDFTLQLEKINEKEIGDLLFFLLGINADFDRSTIKKYNASKGKIGTEDEIGEAVNKWIPTDIMATFNYNYV